MEKKADYVFVLTLRASKHNLSEEELWKKSANSLLKMIGGVTVTEHHILRMQKEKRKSYSKFSSQNLKQRLENDSQSSPTFERITKDGMIDKLIFREIFRSIEKSIEGSVERSTELERPRPEIDECKKVGREKKHETRGG
jgi:hypothetical protein